MKSQLLASTLGIGVNVVSRKEVAPITDGPKAQIVDVVPHEVDRGTLASKCFGVLISDADFQGFGDGLVIGHTVHINSIQEVQGSLRLPRLYLPPNGQ